jgi:recombinational DNA repair ATPase RecF
MSPETQSLILDRLADTGNADEPWALILLAAMEGEAELDAFLDKARSIEPPKRAAAKASAAEPPGAYVGSITVQGFRGIGPKATLTLRPGPGLTLVVGRNGSGKSSFAEGLEYLLTGRNYRWEKRTKVWVDGWRNLHHTPAALEAELVVDGTGNVRVARNWTGDDLATNQTKCIGPGKKACSLETLGWSEALVTFRPFLSYNELGSLLEEGPSKLYDALSKVLGLGEFVELQARLADARKKRQALVEKAGEDAQHICGLLNLVGDTDDERIETTRKALCGKSWDLLTLQRLVDGSETTADGRIEILRRLTAIPLIDVDSITAAASDLRSAFRAFQDLAGTDAARAKRLADILAGAIALHEKHADDDCPVCKAPGALGGSWAAAARIEVERLREEAAAYEAAERILRDRTRIALGMITSPPPVLAEAAEIGVAGLPELRRLWIEWAEGRNLADPPALADHLEQRVKGLAEALESVRTTAAEMLKALEDAWAPIAAAIREWLPMARKALAAKDVIKEIKKAETWWKETSAAVRDERFAPIADRARAVWSQLRLKSNVDLGGIALMGTAGQRKVTLQVTVDGTPAEALGVMSQGELHSLALSLFLPRATLTESPFRFICIDDPVQSMDPARVEGLARVLDDAARTRQVIVFTHDDRLWEAVRRLGIAATVHSVTRRAESVVEVRQTTDPVTSLIEDARAVVLTDNLPQDVASRVVPGFCRSAVEAACMETVRRRRLGKGEAHDAVEELLAASAKLYPLISLALFDDEKRTNDVMPRLKKTGQWAIDAFNVCKMGPHERHEGDLKSLIQNSERLAKTIQGLA